jgi:hypothetical protein
MPRRKAEVFVQGDLFGAGAREQIAVKSRQSLERTKGVNSLNVIRASIEIAKTRKKKETLNVYDALEAERRRTGSKKQAFRNVLAFLNARGQLAVETKVNATKLLTQAEALPTVKKFSYSRNHRRLNMYKIAKMKLEEVFACEFHMALQKYTARGAITPTIERSIVKQAFARVIEFIQLK